MRRSKSRDSAAEGPGGRRPPAIPPDADRARQTAYAIGLRLLAGRELSAARVAEKLTQRGFAPDTVDTVVARLVHAAAIDDARAVRACARTLVKVRMRGGLRAARELQAMGFPAGLVQEALAEVLADVDERSTITRLIEARLRGQTLRDPAAYRRLYASLMRRGFPHGLIRDALKPYWTRGRTAPALDADES